MRSEGDAEIIQSEVADLPGTFTPLIFDVTDAPALEAAAKVVVDSLKGAKLGALINNAGHFCSWQSRDAFLEVI